MEALSKILRQSTDSQLATSLPSEELASKDLPSGFGRIIRDGSGNVELDDEEPAMGLDLEDVDTVD